MDACLKVKKPKEGPPRVRYLSDDELNSLLKACKKSRNRYLYLIALIVITTGVRKSEALNLKWTDVDFDHHLLHIRKTKNGQDRSVSMCDQVYSLLKEHTRSSSLLFPSPNNPSVPSRPVRN